jgi:ketosteroid isomerase-like protein
MSERANAEAEITERFHGWLSAYNSGDIDAFVGYWHPTLTYFFLHGSLLSIGLDKAWLKDYFAAGFKPNLAGQHIGVTIYGDAAVLTAYLVGSFTFPDGTTESGTWRFSEMLARDDNGWKGLHAHFSLLTPEHSISKA